jgi:hypothetical protein
MTELFKLYGNSENEEMEEMGEMESPKMEMEESENQPRKSFEVEYEPKKESEPIPSDAIIKSIRTSVKVKEIENGYLIRKCVYTEYEKPQKPMKGNEIASSWGYHENETVTYSKTKPSDISINYGK